MTKEKSDTPSIFENVGAKQKTDYPQMIAEQIKQMIISKTLSPGDLLPSEPKLCKAFGAGRSTVREAIKILKAENIVEIKKGIGTFIVNMPGVSKDPLGVTFMDKRLALLNLMETRLLIEPNIAALAAKRADSNNIEKIEKIVFETDEILKLNQSHMEVDISFHNAIAEATHNDVLSRIIPIINESIKLGYEETRDILGSFEKATMFHHEVFEAIKQGDSEAARRAMKKHIMQSMRDIVQKSKKQASALDLQYNYITGGNDIEKR